jgi:nicotinamide-nucleotide adenylyltransferase
MDEFGVIHGRFQVLHNDHLCYLLAGKSRCNHLVVGITNPDPSLTRTDESDVVRSTDESNPLSYFERYSVIRSAMRQANIIECDFSIVPFPINLPELYRHYVPLDATFYLTIYDHWGEKKFSIFESMGLKTDILWKKDISQKGISGKDVRRRIIKNEDWIDLVPKSTADFIIKNNIRERLLMLSKTNEK